MGRYNSSGASSELGEIEAALNAHSMVRQSAVVTRKARRGDVRIVAYIVVNGGVDLTVGEIRRYLRASLPDDMIPSFVLTRRSLPLTANGKLDRGALPDVFRSVGDDVGLSEPPAPGSDAKSSARRVPHVGAIPLRNVRLATAGSKRVNEGILSIGHSPAFGLCGAAPPQ